VNTHVKEFELGDKSVYYRWSLHGYSSDG